MKCHDNEFEEEHTGTQGGNAWAKRGSGQGRLERGERLSGAGMEGNAEKARKGLGCQKAAEAGSRQGKGPG